MFHFTSVRKNCEAVSKKPPVLACAKKHLPETKLLGASAGHLKAPAKLRINPVLMEEQNDQLVSGDLVMIGD